LSLLALKLSNLLAQVLSLLDPQFQLHPIRAGSVQLRLQGLAL